MPLIRGPNARPGLINWDHPAAHGVQLLAVANGGAGMVDLVQRERGTLNGTVTASQDAFIGAGVNVNTASSGVSFTNRPTGTPVNFTLAALVKFTTGGAATGICSTNTATGSGVELGTTAANVPVLRAAAGTAASATTALTAGGIYFIAASHAQVGASSKSAIISRRIDGSTVDYTTGANNQTASAGTTTWELGKVTRIWKGNIVFGLINLGIFLNIRQLIEWSENPWSVFAPARSWPALTSLGAIFPPGVQLEPSIVG